MYDVFHGLLSTAINFSRVNVKTEEGTQREVLITKLILREAVLEKDGKSCRPQCTVDTVS